MGVKLRDLLVGKDYFVVDHDDENDDEERLKNRLSWMMMMTMTVTPTMMPTSTMPTIPTPVRRRSCEGRGRRGCFDEENRAEGSQAANIIVMMIMMIMIMMNIMVKIMMMMIMIKGRNGNQTSSPKSSESRASQDER